MPIFWAFLERDQVQSHGFEGKTKHAILHHDFVTRDVPFGWPQGVNVG
jgi:hypothetical protein